MPDNEVPPEVVEARTRWFHAYVDKLENESVRRVSGSGPHACPCCANLTLDSRGEFEICSVCFWEDDGQDDHDADVVRGGPNGSLSLTEARRNFAAMGACDERCAQFVRAPEPHEIPQP
ncbi:CPCC family cysteine-rich protein [Yinghuangia sp. YIM S09857]|uniref:CPCC family cysteine-rich protein n=1 Tax=Yinghuangia sp. YIM S09857 TaxID=3436929 RepID=UPI003F533A50